MKPALIMIPLLALTACSSGKPGSETAAVGRKLDVVNAGFEQPANDGTIPGWTPMMHADPGSFQMRVDTEVSHQGHGSFHITRVRNEPYGMISQDIDATPYSGKTLELSAMSKTRDVGAKGWKLVLNGNARNTLIYSAPLTGTQDWQRQSVTLKVTPLVRKVSFGGILLDAGDAWLDDVELKLLD
jgi:hypothetical protein